MKAPVGAVVRLYYDGVMVAAGEYLRTDTGRLYDILHVRVQRRGKHRGRQHLVCTVVSLERPGALVHRLRWYRRSRRR